MNIKSIIQKEQEKVLSLLIQRYVVMAWAQKCIDETPDEIINLDTKQLKEEIESERYNLKSLDEADKKIAEWKIKQLTKKGEDYNKYLQDLENVNESAQDRLKSDVFSYKKLSNCEKDISDLLK